MTLALMTKHPADKLDYDMNFEEWLTDDDAIASATAVTSGGSATIDLVQTASTYVKVWVSGGVDGETNEIAVTVVTTDGRTKEECFRLRIKDC